MTQICVMYSYTVSVYRKVGVSQYTRLATKSVLVTVQKNTELILAYMERYTPHVISPTK